ncbi:MAG: iron-sulfur cluster assembly scaffold protein [Anaerolinea sp.]|nr:iron-sulfur cluster assembly scaffold protein [Anaerolinea sp.]MCC6976394.1 iron-sulfur cluster assembly scaffold protein [Anaerolineae bacterium]CAG1011029.1 Zinc-dependent sulfurtransferase SufU [Anaerolineae bacterium]
MDMYHELILDHYRDPRNWAILDPADIDHEEKNPLCGDRLRLTLRVRDGIITEVGWSGEGCAISQASASMLGETLVGKSLEEARAITKEDILEMLGISLGPVRLKCALLSLKTLKIGVYGLSGWHTDEE